MFIGMSATGDLAPGGQWVTDMRSLSRIQG